MTNAATKERQHYRIRYPAVERPRLEIKGKAFPVADLSESGLRFQATAGGFAERAVVDGELVMPSTGDRRRVKGAVVRLDEGGFVALRLEQRWFLPLSLVMSEQRRLIKAGHL